MEINVRGKNISITPGLEEYTCKKVSKLAKLCHNPIRAEVVQSVKRGQQIVEITLKTNEQTFRAEQKTNDMYASIVGAVAKLERQLEKLKSKYRSSRKGAFGSRGG